MMRNEKLHITVELWRAQYAEARRQFRAREIDEAEFRRKLTRLAFRGQGLEDEVLLNIPRGGVPYP